MSIEVKVPVLPESVSDATIAAWHKKPGDAVKRDENLVDLETDKVVLEVPAPADGVLKEIRHPTGDTVNSEDVIAILEEGAVAEAAPAKAAVASKTPETPAPAPTPAAGPGTGDRGPAKATTDNLSPSARRMATEEKIDTSKVAGTGRGGQVTKEDLVNYAKAPAAPDPRSPVPGPTAVGPRPEERVPMTRIRARIAERLMQSKNSIAMLTSFNEVNLAQVVAMRKQLGEAFEKTHGIKLGFMSFFVKAACEALKRHPVVNASVDGNDIIYHGYQDISIAVATERGLVTPVLRDVQDMSFAEVEKAIADFARKAREGGLTLDDLQGGTFTITNGGTFGSLFSTPIVNPPQSGILGMHTIKERAVVENGQVVAAPMMYIAISYDHRIVDGKDAVLFLVDIKNQLENPHKMLLGI
ncbi:MAG: 2-oxoglutarate dehydrogenase complex dihydrolipoyllysine-residue succinyltransferase [Xanthomonadales bacterium]|nr:2-oxoglutarate dehydrogenase complex dihydrolipoyllysine-residue succinyltransferase [Xanthomonadales bacterium]ODU95219.1 MAG: dihydrolipoamide succinyltransferase [Rhodanobacter sp. SCN 66-43]OJY82947.1 MAG: dihydrolipoamide succinyltransferase [Xanthomonadales bacterium 66-474]